MGKSKSTISGAQGILTPLVNLKFAQKDKIEKVKVQNMRALVDDGGKVVTMRCITPMDREPMHLLQALQGMMVVLTNDYLGASSS